MGVNLRCMRRDEGQTEGSNEGSPRLPPGYSLEAKGPDLLVLRRPDGSVVAAFAFSAFGPTPESIRETAEEDLRKDRRAERREDAGEGRGR